MVFDLVSFLAGVAAGALTAGLAGLLHSLENTASIQERLRLASQRLDELARTLIATGSPVPSDPDAKAKVDDLQLMLDDIHEEIRRMYKRASR